VKKTKRRVWVVEERCPISKVWEPIEMRERKQLAQSIMAGMREYRRQAWDAEDRRLSPLRVVPYIPEEPSR
jgi:hypothetical protein